MALKRTHIIAFTAANNNYCYYFSNKINANEILFSKDGKTFSLPGQYPYFETEGQTFEQIFARIQEHNQILDEIGIDEQAKIFFDESTVQKQLISVFIHALGLSSEDAYELLNIIWTGYIDDEIELIAVAKKFVVGKKDKDTLNNVLLKVRNVVTDIFPDENGERVRRLMDCIRDPRTSYHDVKSLFKSLQKEDDLRQN